jgi:RNA polymerase sigma factor (sigma-70 family)
VEGQRARFDSMYRAHYEDVRRFVGRRLAFPAAEDAAAEVFVVAWRRFDEVGSQEALLPWLYGVARLVLANEFRRARRADALARRVTEFADRLPATGHAEGVAEWLTVAAAFDRLAEADQEVLRLVGWEELGVSEVARVLGCGRTAAAMRISRARKRLLRAMRVSAADQVPEARMAAAKQEGEHR